jgi:glucoamylase
MPLVWAHSEYVKLKRSLHDGRVFDMPPQTVQRYQVKKSESPNAIWRFNHKCRTMPVGKTLRVEVLAPATVHWSEDGWRTVHDTPTKDTGLGVHCADLLTSHISAGGTVEFTFYWNEAGKWENTNFAVTISEA